MHTLNEVEFLFVTPQWDVYCYILMSELEMRIVSQDKWILLLRMNYEKIRRENAKIFMGTSDFIVEEE